MKKYLSNRTASFFAIVLSVFFVVATVQAATTISTNIQTGGTLSVTGISTFTGNVGIGTTSPSAKLSISNSAGDTGATPLFAIASTTGGTSTSTLFTVLNSGNVGIGTTTPQAKLSIANTNGNINFGDTYGEGSYNGVWLNGTTSDAGYNFQSSSQDPSLYINVPSGNNIYFGQGDSMNAAFNSSGFLGIGETAPGSKLSVSGGGTFGASYDTTAAPTNGLIIEGNVGIGTTTPERMLSVRDTASTTLQLALNDSTVNIGQGTGAVDFAINDASSYGVVSSIKNVSAGTTASFGNLAFYTGSLASSIAEAMRITSAGNVGIGTTTPTVPLQVTTSSSNATTSIEIGKAGQNKGSCLVMYDVAGTVQHVTIQGGAFVISLTSCK